MAMPHGVSGCGALGGGGGHVLPARWCRDRTG